MIKSFTPDELQRYQRQMILPEVGPAGQQKLESGRVLVVGAGGLGCPVLSYLTAAGVGTILVADEDRVERSNLHRQVLFGESAIGRVKADRAVEILRDLNPSISLRAIPARVSVNNIRDLLAEVDIVVDCTDNFAAKYLLNDACVELDKVLVSGSLFAFEGQLSVFNTPLPSGGRGPTYRCLFPYPPDPRLIPSCAEAGVLGVLPGVIGALQATEVLKILVGIGEVLSGRLLLFEALQLSFREIFFRRNSATVAATSIQSAYYYQRLNPACSADEDIITPLELKRRLDSDEELVLIDVREPSEKQLCDIGGKLIPLGVLCENLEQIPRDKPVVLYCQRGGRSQKGLESLRNGFGFSNVLSLSGGIDQWNLAFPGEESPIVNRD